jgi:hypothetical protein
MNRLMCWILGCDFFDESGKSRVCSVCQKIRSDWYIGPIWIRAKQSIYWDIAKLALGVVLALAMCLLLNWFLGLSDDASALINFHGRPEAVAITPPSFHRLRSMPAPLRSSPRDCRAKVPPRRTPPASLLIMSMRQAPGRMKSR